MSSKGFKKVLEDSLIEEDKKKLDYDGQQLSMQFPAEATARIDAMAEFYKCEPGGIVAMGLALMEQKYLEDAKVSE